MLHRCPTAALTVELRARRAGLLRETSTVMDSPRAPERRKVLQRGLGYAIVALGQRIAWSRVAGWTAPTRLARAAPMAMAIERPRPPALGHASMVSNDEKGAAWIEGP